MNKLTRRLASATLLVITSLGAKATPTTFGFEELTVPAHTVGAIPDGYAGAIWTGWILRRTVELNGTGLNSNDGSSILAIGIAAAPEINFSQNVSIDGLFAINPFSKLAYELYLDGEWVGSSGSRVAGGASYMPSNYSGALDRIVFHPGDASGFSIDDLSVSPAAVSEVPEPDSLALLLGGLAAFGAVRSIRPAVSRPSRAAARPAPRSSPA